MEYKFKEILNNRFIIRVKKSRPYLKEVLWADGKLFMMTDGWGVIDKVYDVIQNLAKENNYPSPLPPLFWEKYRSENNL